MSDQRQKVLLTGGAGFIGSHLAEALLLPGAQLIIGDNLNSFYDCTLKQTNLEAIRRVGMNFMPSIFAKSRTCRGSWLSPARRWSLTWQRVPLCVQLSSRNCTSTSN